MTPEDPWTRHSKRMGRRSDSRLEELLSFLDAREQSPRDYWGLIYSRARYDAGYELRQRERGRHD